MSVDHVESSDESSQNYDFATIEDVRLFFLNTGSRVFDPVSYTHLDVYKRQIQCGVLVFKLKLLLNYNNCS